MADRHCDGRMVLVQEGGYARSYSALCMHATLEGVLGVTDGLLADPMAFCRTTPRAPIARSRPLAAR